MKLASIQSNYIPWKGYFDIINMADVFLLFDSAQYTERDWRNRNRLMSRHGPKWLTIPVRKGKGVPIGQVHALNNTWRRRHWESIRHWYGTAPYFKELRPFFRELYLGSDETNLSQINYSFIQAVCDLLSIRTRLLCETVNPVTRDKNGVILDLCSYFRADVYITGPAAKSYIDERLFQGAGVVIQWIEYSGYPECQQRHGLPFVHQVSILDLLFNQGVEGTRRHMLSFDSQ